MNIRGRMMDLSVKKSITYIFIIICFALLTAHLTIGVVASQSPLSVSLVDLYSTPPYSITSRSTSRIKVHVSSTGTPIPGANVSLYITNDDTSMVLDSTKGGTLSPTSEITDDNGDVSITYAPPPAESPYPISISATATKIGYLGGQGEMEVQIQPSLDISVTSKPSIIKPGQKSKITVHVTIYGTDKPVSGAWAVLKSLNGGTFSQNRGETNDNGEFITEYTAPDIKDGTDLISISVEKSGFGGRTSSWISMKISEIALAPPILISPADAEVVDPLPVLKWNPTEGAKEYEVFLGDMATLIELKDGIITTLSDYTFKEPLSNGTYYWKVRAVDEFGQYGPLSEIRSFNVFVSIPPSIDEFFLENTTFVSGGEVLLRAHITQGNSPITSVEATIKKPDSTSDKLEMELKDGLYEGIYVAPMNFGNTSMEFEVNLMVEDFQGGVATLPNPQKFNVMPIQKFNLTVRSTPEGLPTMPTSGIYEYAQGSIVSLSNDQKSSEKFEFEHWLVDGDQVVGNVIIDKNHEAVAVFKEVEEKIESKPEVVAPITTPPSEAAPITEEPTITTAPPTTEAPSIPISTPSKVQTTSSRRVILIAIILAVLAIAISRASPELIKAKVRGLAKKEIEPKEEPVALEVEETEEEAEEPAEIPVVEPEIPEIEPEKGIVKEKVEEIKEEPKEISVVEAEILGLLVTIKEIVDSGEDATLRILVRKLLNKDPKMTMKDVLAHLDDTVAMGLTKKDLLKNKDGIIEVKYSLTDVGTDCVMDSL